ncbi:hypothetical protein [Methylobacterium sp. CM6257]
MKGTKLTAEEGSSLLLKAEAARQELAATQSYLQRGRVFKDLSDADLRECWVETCREWAKRGMYDRPEAYDDAEAELRLRGLPTPVALVQHEMETLCVEADAVRERMTAKDYEKMGAELVSRYVKQREQEN